MCDGFKRVEDCVTCVDARSNNQKCKECTDKSTKDNKFPNYKRKES